MLTSILGGLGSGKTLLMVILSYFSDKQTIISNINLKLEGKTVEEFNRNKFIQAQYENCIILLDEAYTYLESRISGSEINRIFGYILFQSRKKNVEFYITVQLFSSIDKRFRELSDVVIVANQRQNEYDDFKYFIDDKKKVSILAFDYLKILPFFEFYDTNQIILSDNEKMIFDTKNSDEKDKAIEEYADIIEEYYNNEGLENITKSMVQLYVMKKDLPKFLSEAIFATLKIRKKRKEKV